MHHFKTMGAPPLGHPNYNTRGSGRTTSLDEDKVLIAEKWIDEIEQNSIITQKGFNSDGEISWQKTAPIVPTKARLAVILDVSQDTLSDWAYVMKCKDNETGEIDPYLVELQGRIAAVLERIKNKSEAILVEGGAAGVLNSSVAIRILSAKHNYKERIDETTNDKDLPTPILSGVEEKTD